MVIRKSYYENSTFILALLILITLLSSSFFLFWNLSEISIHNKDEYLHFTATHEMWNTGKWWLPTVDGKPYFNKPPLKMWLTFIPIFLLGESNFSYRLIDALSGSCVIFLVFLLTRKIYRSNFAGLFAGLSLLSCHALLFEHGFRSLNQDAFLLLLITISLPLGYKLLTAPTKNLKKNELLRLTIIFSSLIGFGTLVKSVAIYIVFIVLACFWLISRIFFPSKFKISFKTLLIIGLVSLLIPSLYFLPHAIWTPGAFGTFWGYEVAYRAQHGFHNLEHPYYYLRTIIDQHSYFPAEVILLAIGAGIINLIRKRNSLEMLVITWAIVPILFYSLIPSKVVWYIFPAMPAIAILIGGVLDQLLRYITRIHTKERRNYFPTLCIALTLFCISIFRIGEFCQVNAHEIKHPPKRLLLDKVISEINVFRKIHSDLKINIIDTVVWAKYERPYIRGLERMVIRPREINKLIGLLSKKQVDLLFIDSSNLHLLDNNNSLHFYVDFPAYGDRKNTAYLVIYPNRFMQLTDLLTDQSITRTFPHHSSRKLSKL